jgi:hypothetical protein
MRSATAAAKTWLLVLLIALPGCGAGSSRGTDPAESCPQKVMFPCGPGSETYCEVDDRGCEQCRCVDSPWQP